MNRVTVLIMGLIFLGASLVFAQTEKAVDAGNTICPVSGEKVPAPGEKSAMGGPATYEYHGKIYHLCCPMCIKDFKKNPEKYSAIADKKVKDGEK